MNRTGTTLRLIGRYYHALEQKGRLSIPKTFRDQLKPEAVLTTGLDGCCFLFPQGNWQQVALEAHRLPLTQKAARDWVRYLSNNAASVSFDSQGRILIPEHLRQYGDLRKEVVVVGSLSRVEIWDRARYHQYLDTITNQAEQIAESLTESAEDR